MSRRTAVVVANVGLAAGCVAPRHVPPLDPVRPAAWQPAAEPAAAHVVARSQRPDDLGPRRPRHILVLSGGGAFGAFTAGLLNGWSQAGTRAEFDVVTGVSTGGLIAPLAFAGPAADGVLKRLYTDTRQRDVVTFRAWATVPFRDAAGDPAPLRRTVERALTPELVGLLAAEHRKGRRLYVGTTNLDARRFTVWDVGAVAAAGRADARALIADLLMASAAVPGVFPPVPVEVEVDGRRYTELHVDGGASAPLFLPTAVLDAGCRPAAGGDRPAADRPTVYLVVAGKYQADPKPVRPRVLRVLGAAAGAVVHNHLRAEAANLYHACTAAGAEFRTASVRQDLPTADTSLGFDPGDMAGLFAEGLAVGAAGPAWQTEPPEKAPGDAAPIRTGTRFRSDGPPAGGRQPR